MELWLIQIIVGAVLNVAGTLIKNMNKPKAKASGFQGTAQVGGDHPLAFIMGWYATAGKLEYAGTWGNAGDTPNAYLTKVFTLSDLPVRGLAGLLVNGARCTLGDTPHATRGYPVLEFRKGSKDHLWVRFNDGNQTTADSLLISAFGLHPDRPWQTDMIGRGVAYGITTALFNREIFNREPEVVWELDGIALDDPRGDDEHENPAVAIDNVLRGFSYEGAWLWGPQGIAAHHLPSAVWEPQMDKCDALVDLEGGGTEKRFRFGLEVRVDQEPHEVIDDLLKACSGRIAEIGGIYKILVGEPDAPVISFTDEDVIITEGQSFEPFPGLEATFNAITATYPEPAEGWETKEAPPRYSSTWESQDDGRRLPFSTSFDAVPFPNQVQRLMRPAIEEARRFRRHSHTMPPEWWEYEVLDVAEWTSVRNGYEDKAFLITVMEDRSSASQLVGLQEIDPADYDWSSDYELPYDIAPLTIARPAPQPMTGWSVAPYTHVDDAAQARRPGIEVGFAAGLVDVRAVRVQIRRDGETDPFFDGEYPYDPAIVAPAIYIVASALLPAQPYEARGIYLPFSGRETEWSAWLDVTTPNVKLTAADIDIELDELAGEIAEQIRWIGSSVRDVLRKLEITGRLVAEQDLANFDTFDQLRRSTKVQLDELTASFDEVIEVALGPGGAIATALSSLYAAMGGNSAEVLVRWEAVAAPTGVAARWALQLRVVGEAFASAGIYLEVTDLGVSRIVLDASQTVITTDGGTNVEAMFDEDGAVIRDLRVGTIEGPAGNFWNLTTGAFRVSGGS
jgi:hypothetical protein